MESLIIGGRGDHLDMKESVEKKHLLLKSSGNELISRRKNADMNELNHSTDLRQGSTKRTLICCLKTVFYITLLGMMLGSRRKPTKW